MKNQFSRFTAVAAILFLCAGMVSAQNDPPHARNNKTGHVMLQPSGMQWVDAPNSLPAGAKITILEGDPAKAGPFTLRLQLPADYKVMPHYHPAIEHVTVLEGELFMGHGDKFDETKATGLEAGSFSAIPLKTNHFAFTKSQPAIIQLHGIGPWDIIYLDPSEDPRKKKGRR